MSNRGQNVAPDFKKEVSDFFGGLMIQPNIHKNVLVAEAASACQSIIEFDPSAPGAFDFIKLSKERLAEDEPQEEKRTATRSK